MRLLTLAFVMLLAATTASFSADEPGTFHTQVLIERGSGPKAAVNSGVIIWLSPLGDATNVPAAAPVHVRMMQKNKQFEPRLAVIPVGSSVDFPNQDPFFHNVFSLYNGKRFDLGLYEAGGSKSVRFDRPGVSFIFCNIHPMMTAAIVVLTTPYYAVSNPAGDVVIRNVLPGRYRMDVWYERSSPEALSTLSRQVNLTSDLSIPTLHIPETVQGTVAHTNKFGKEYDTSHPYQTH